MRVFTTSLVSTVLAGALLAPSLLAHGGVYNGPKDTVPPGTDPRGPRTGDRPGTPSGPKTPTPGTPSVPTPGQPDTGRPIPGSRRTTPVTGRGTPLSFDDDLTGWQFWWEFNKEPYLELRNKLFKVVSSGYDGFAFGRGLKSDLRNTLAPSKSDLQGTVIPALEKALADPRSSRDMVSACLIALAKIGGSKNFVQRCKPFLAKADQEQRETAALALGIAANPAARGTLEALVLDNREGRKLVKRGAGVRYRTRSFACYGYGLLAYQSKSLEFKRRCFELMRGIVDDERRSRRDVHIAALQAIRLLRIDPTSDASKALRNEVADWLMGFVDRKTVHAQIRAHGYQALAKLYPRRGSCPDALKERLVDALSKRKTRHWLRQSATLSLGELCTPTDSKACKALQKAFDRGKEQQTRYFAAIALGQIGGQLNKEFLRKRLNASRTQALHKPWLSLGLAVLAWNERQKDATELNESTADDIARAMRDTASPLLAAGHAISLGLLRAHDHGDAILDRLLRHKSDEEPAGYFAVALGLLGFTDAKMEIGDIIDRAKRRNILLTQASISLGLLGDREISRKLVKRLDGKATVAVYASLSQALGYIGDRHAIHPLVGLLADSKKQPLSRAFAAAALGRIGDKEDLPWNSKLRVGINYRANVETLTSPQGTGILDIL